jgi:hypothetical protein
VWLMDQVLANVEFVGFEGVGPGEDIGCSCRSVAQDLGSWAREVRQSLAGAVGVGRMSR